MDVIFIEFDWRPDLLMAIRIGDPKYSGHYDLHELRYPDSLLSEIKKGNQFKEIKISELPEDLDYIYEWGDPRSNEYYKKEALRAYIYKQ